MVQGIYRRNRRASRVVDCRIPECVKHVDGARAAAHIVLRKRA